MLTQPIRLRKAFGLLEVLIVLAIAATTMLAATQIALDGFRSIKLNEVLDYANGLMLQALEIAKSPTDVEIVAGTQPTNFEASYRLTTNSAGKAVMSVVTTSTTPLTVANCSTSSPYFVDANIPNITDPIICLQLTVTQRTNFGQVYYEIRSRLVYNLNGSQNERQIIGYRRDGFKFTQL
ncbi:MAG: prepilin-type N-terminal cleavage/methylation domain-containing protein [Candidatus Doudnabacteria bacterium]|nr:prepilin-type N-terminal cleavage/methylation domain-containing protein [Candidatus Doudnabacteria bacterium]